MEQNIDNKKYKPNMLNMKNFQIAVGATLILQPLEVMQTSMIATGYSKHNINFKGLSLLAAQIYKDEGMKGFYRGTVLSIAKNTVSFSLFFTGIESPPSYYPVYLQSILNLAIASSSKLAGTVASTPLAVMKTKMQIVGNNEYNRIHLSFMKIAKDEGFFGFYRGLFATILKDVPFSGIQYTIYRNLLDLSNYIRKESDSTHNSLIVALCGSSAATLAILLTYPFDNLRIRQQAEKQNDRPQKEHIKVREFQDFIKDIYQGQQKNVYRVVFCGWYMRSQPQNKNKKLTEDYIYFYLIMSTAQEQQRLYEDLIEKLHTSEDIKEKFESKTVNGLLDKDYAHEVLIDCSESLNYDLSDAINYFDLDNPDVPPEEIRQQLNFDSFVNLVQKWLQKSLQLTSPKQKQSTNQDQYWFKSEPGTMNTEQSDLKHQEQLIRAIFETQEAKTKKVFNEYAMMSDQPDTISKSDFPLLLKNLLYQHNASIYEKGGQEDYFMRSNSYGNLNQILKDEQINYQQFKEAAIQFIRGNQDLILLEQEQVNKKKEKQQSVHQTNLEEELLAQIEKYQQILHATEPEIEKQVLRNMITTLVRQLDLIRDNTMKLDETNINTTLKQKHNLQVSFSGIVRPERRAKTKEEIEIEKRDSQIREIFLFFSKQQYVNGVAYEFDRYTKEAQNLSLGMFLYFCKCFTLIQKHVREPDATNLLEKKKRGEDVNITKLNETVIKKKPQEEAKQNDQESTIISPQKPPTVPVDIKKIENLPRRNKYSNVPSKFEWWNDELKFDKYYNPNQPILPQQIMDNLKYLKKDEIKTLFKKSAFGKDLDFDEFKCILGLMANMMFTQNGERHPHAYQLMLRLLYIDYPEEYRKRLIPIKIPFNCKEKLGFRALPGFEHHEYKGRQLTEQEKQQLQRLKQERENQLRERLTENPNQSIRSIGSIGSNSLANLPYNKQQGRFLNGRIDLDREKVSWAKLENLNPNDLSGHGRNFKPQDLIDEFEDEEDRFFLKEFSLEEERKNQPKPEEVQRSLEKYGSYKPVKRPTQKHQQSQPQLLNQRYDQKSVDMKNQYMQRANQIQQQQDKKEQQLLQKINKQYKM